MLRFDASIEEELARVDALWTESRYAEGYRILESLLFREPGYGKAHAYMAWYAYAQVGDYELAVRHYDLALHFNAAFAGIYPNYVIVLIAMRRYTAAIDMARRGMNVPGTNRAMLIAEVGRAEEAVHNFRVARRAYRSAYLLAERPEEMANLKVAMRRVGAKRRAKMIGIF